MTGGPSRALPHPGLRGEVVHVGRSDPGEVVAVRGRTITVRLDRDGSQLDFELSRLTAHWVQTGQAYFGPRFMPRRDSTDPAAP